MDLLKIVKDKIIKFDGTDSKEGLEAVIHHIEIAERHFENGGKMDEYLYTDVIYRTNQAFEGALKEAFRSFSSNEPAKKTPAQIEKYLESNKVLKERVLEQFKNYRSEWRNKSTHDYKLFFSSQEALLAIVSVSAFFSILLDEMLEKQAFETEVEDLKKHVSKITSQLHNYNALDFHQQCLEIFTKFSVIEKREGGFDTDLSEFELRGRLSAFISSVDPEITVEIEKRINIGSSHAYIDMILRKGGNSIIVELKRPSKESRLLEMRAVQQIISYLAVTQLTDGIVYIPPYSKSSKVEVSNQVITNHGLKQSISVVRA
ncbi:TPA: hypothetical protein NJ546_004602 [Vibrio parahaemolyticus]|nr:hypothetical protein [Vibrio parahaemolyticus]